MKFFTRRKIIIAFLVVVALIAVGLRFFRNRGPIGPTPDEIVKELLEFDRNGDGQLSQDELSERMQGLITRGDDNRDGVLTKDELRKLATAQYEATQRSQRERR